MSIYITDARGRDTKFTRDYRRSRDRYFAIVEDENEDPNNRLFNAVWLIQDLMAIVSDALEPAAAPYPPPPGFF